MSQQAVEDKPKVSKKDYERLETSNAYLEREFPKEDGEYLVKYVNVFGDCFRINFFKKRNPTERFSASYISRSYFVTLSKKGKSWKHKVK
jgi:hypothetical protein